MAAAVMCMLVCAVATLAPVPEELAVELVELAKLDPAPASLCDDVAALDSDPAAPALDVPLVGLVLAADTSVRERLADPRWVAARIAPAAKHFC